MKPVKPVTVHHYSLDMTKTAGPVFKAEYIVGAGGINVEVHRGEREHVTIPAIPAELDQIADWIEGVRLHAFGPRPSPIATLITQLLWLLDGGGSRDDGDAIPRAHRVANCLLYGGGYCDTYDQDLNGGDA